ncbi:MAG TPA: YeeE/YedE thiosulfate transporter family protein, partial [Ottowia sp.]|nr:YeeE/YedE thiosulfate transporter family protein [Ottowia sp.]
RLHLGRLPRRWLWGALGLALLAALNLLIAGQPWGVVYGFGLWAAKAATALGLFDPAANAFWSDPGHAERLSQTLLLDVTSITNIGILAGALWVSARRPEPPRPLTSAQWAIGLLAGFAMGYSSRLAFGCNVGAMVSGISTGSLHGWLWVPLAFAGTLVGLRVRRRFGF